MHAIEFYQKNKESLITLFGFVMVFVFGFFSGYFYLLDKTEDRGVVIEEPGADCAALFGASGISSAGNSPENIVDPDATVALADIKVKPYVASKNSKIFHRADCPFAQKIKEENKVWFQTEDDAKKQGFSLHEHCANGHNN